MRSTQLTRFADTVRKLLARGATRNALHILSQLHAADIARLLGQLPAYRKIAFQSLMEMDPRLASEALRELDPANSAELVQGMSASQIGLLMQELEMDDAAAMVAELPEKLQEDVLRALRGQTATEVRRLLRHGRRTAGRIMSPNVLFLTEDATMADAIHRLQDSAELEMVFYLYVVDERRHLLGVLSLRQLLLKGPETSLRETMTRNVVRVTTDTDQEKVADLVASYDLLSIPFVDEENKLVGIVTIDDVIDIIKEEATEDSTHSPASVLGNESLRRRGRRSGCGLLGWR